VGKRKKKHPRPPPDEQPAEPELPKAPERINNPFADALKGVEPARARPARSARGQSPKRGSQSAAQTRGGGADAPRGGTGGNRPAREAAQSDQGRSPSKGPAPPVDRPEYSYEDRVAFNQAFAGVQPLKPRRAKPVREKQAAAPRPDRSTPAPPDPNQEPEAEQHARARLTSLVAQGVRFKVHREADGYVEGARADSPPSVMRSVTRQVAPEAELDLHGMRGDEVDRRLTGFVRSRYHKGDRELLIVHGKGIHSEDGTAVLGDRALKVLTDGGAAPFVLAFASAPQRLGGTGALIVRLVP
jgi:DNA-nicking Smr family endonuclease